MFSETTSSSDEDSMSSSTSTSTSTSSTTTSNFSDTNSSHYSTSTSTKGGKDRSLVDQHKPSSVFGSQLDLSSVTYSRFSDRNIDNNSNTQTTTITQNNYKNAIHRSIDNTNYNCKRSLLCGGDFHDQFNSENEPLQGLQEAATGDVFDVFFNGFDTCEPQLDNEDEFDDTNMTIEELFSASNENLQKKQHRRRRHGLYAFRRHIHATTANRLAVEGKFSESVVQVPRWKQEMDQNAVENHALSRAMRRLISITNPIQASAIFPDEVQAVLQLFNHQNSTSLCAHTDDSGTNIEKKLSRKSLITKAKELITLKRGIIVEVLGPHCLKCGKQMQYLNIGMKSSLQESDLPIETNHNGNSVPVPVSSVPSNLFDQILLNAPRCQFCSSSNQFQENVNGAISACENENSECNKDAEKTGMHNSVLNMKTAVLGEVVARWLDGTVDVSVIPDGEKSYRRLLRHVPRYRIRLLVQSQTLRQRMKKLESMFFDNTDTMIVTRYRDIFDKQCAKLRDNINFTRTELKRGLDDAACTVADLTSACETANQIQKNYLKHKYIMDQVRLLHAQRNTSQQRHHHHHYVRYHKSHAQRHPSIIGKRIRFRYAGGSMQKWRKAIITSYSTSRRAFLLQFINSSRGTFESCTKQHRSEWVNLAREHRRVQFETVPYNDQHLLKSGESAFIAKVSNKEPDQDDGSP